MSKYPEESRAYSIQNGKIVERIVPNVENKLRNALERAGLDGDDWEIMIVQELPCRFLFVHYVEGYWHQTCTLAKRGATDVELHAQGSWKACIEVYDEMLG